MPWLAESRVPMITAMIAAISPSTNVTAPSTTALAASTRPRRGVAARVTRIRPRRYSAVMNMTPTTTITISPANTPIRVCAIVTPFPAAPDTDGAMSPVPVTVNRPAAAPKPPGEPAAGPPGAPIAEPAQPPPAQPPRRLSWSNTPVARLGPPDTLDRPRDVCAYCGDVANKPPGTVEASPASVTVPTLVQRLPLAES